MPAGEFENIHFGNQLTPYDFYDVQSYLLGTCPGSVQVSWALMR